MPADSFATQIAAASAMVRRFCNRDFDSIERTEIHDAGPQEFGVNEWPVSSIASFTFVDDTASTELVADTDYRLDARIGLIRLASKPRQVWRNLEVRYVGGYATIPADLDFATALIAAALWEQAQRSGSLAGVKREKLGAYEYELLPSSERGIGKDGIPDSARGILVQYRRTVI